MGHSREERPQQPLFARRPREKRLRSRDAAYLRRRAASVGWRLDGGHSTANARPDRLSEAGFIETGTGTWLRPETDRSSQADDAIQGMLVFRQRPILAPETLAGFWKLSGTAEAYQAFEEAATPLASLLEKGALPPLDAIAARTLLIHEWRRIVLHDPGLPAELLPRDWPGETARRIACDIYAKLATPSEKWLDSAGLPPLTNPRQFAGRFGMNRKG